MKIPMAMWPRLMPLLDQALDQPPEQREAWMRAQALDEDTAAALRQLLADRQELDSGDFMAALPKLDAMPSASVGLPGEGDAGRASQTGASQCGLFAGDMLGPYRLIRPLGQGGMSVVWLAERDDGQMRRHVALKMPHAGPGQALLAERLRRERDILASLEHRHIARLYDVGTTPQGLPFLVLEYIEGEALHAYCDAHRLGIHERLRLFLQVLSAVQYAHTKLVLHRDLKPSNILVNAQGEVKLLDFGIAKLIKDSETGAAPSTELTQHSGHVLTPDYAAPEQIAGRPLTTASDVYALGVILFELITGQRPYRLPRGTRGALEEAILATDPRRPSQVWLEADVQTHHPTAVTLTDLADHFGASPRRLSQLTRGDLDVIVCTALQKDAARRYPTAEAFAQDIQHHLAKEPIAAQPDSRWYRTRKYMQRHAWALSAVGAIVMALSAGLSVALWQAREARQEAAKATAIKDFLIGLFENGDVEQADALRKRQQTVEQLLVNSADALGTQLKDHPGVRAELQGVVGGLLHNLAITDAAIKLRQQRVAQLEAMGASVAERAQAWRDLADSQDARGDTIGAKQSLEKGLALCAGAGMAPVAVCYGLQVAKSAQLVLAGQFDEVNRLIAPALLALQQKAAGSMEMAEALVVQGDALSAQGRFDDSYKLYQQSIRLRASIWGRTSAKLAREQYQLAMGLGAQRRLDQSREQLLQAWQTMSAAMGPDHANTLVIELQLGRVQVLQSNSREGQKHIQRASGKLLARSSGLDARSVFDVELALSEALLIDGRLHEAAPHVQRALALAERLRGRIPNEYGPAANYAWYLQDTGQVEQARQVLMQARERLSKSRSQADPWVAYIDERIAGTYLAQGKWDDAWSRYEAGFQLKDFREDQYGSTKHSLTQGQAVIMMERGNFEAAIPVIEAQYNAMLSTPAEQQYLLTRYSVTEQMGRLRAGMQRCDEALSFFGQAIDMLKDGYGGSPYLASTRARYGQCLLKLGQTDQARQQLKLAEKAFRDSSHLADHIKKPYIELKAALREQFR